MRWFCILLGLIISVAFVGASPIVINEVSFGDVQWVELYNASGAEVNLDHWVLKNAKGSDELSGQIGPYDYLVIVESKSLFLQAFPDVDPSKVIEVEDGSIGDGLSNTSDMVALYDKNGELVDCINWGQPDPYWPNYIPDLWNPGIMPFRGVIARIPNGQDTDSPYDFKSVNSATPGTKNPDFTGLDASSWGKIKAIFSGGRKNFRS